MKAEKKKENKSFKDWWYSSKLCIQLKVMACRRQKFVGTYHDNEMNVRKLAADNPIIILEVKYDQIEYNRESLNILEKSIKDLQEKHEKMVKENKTKEAEALLEILIRQRNDVKTKRDNIRNWRQHTVTYIESNYYTHKILGFPEVTADHLRLGLPR